VRQFFGFAVSLRLLRFFAAIKQLWVSGFARHRERTGTEACPYHANNDDSIQVAGHNRHRIQWTVRVTAPIYEKTCVENRIYCGGPILVRQVQ
jgi:hypothetical protein